MSIHNLSGRRRIIPATPAKGDSFVDFALKNSRPAKRLEDHQYKIIQCTLCGKVFVTEANEKAKCPKCSHTFKIRDKGAWNCNIRLSNSAENAGNYARHWEDCLSQGITDPRQINDKYIEKRKHTTT